MSNNLSELSSLLAYYLCDHTKSVEDLQDIFEICLVTREKTQLIQQIMQTLNSPNVSRQQLYYALTLIQNNQSVDPCQGYFQQGNYPENEQYHRYDYEQHNYSDNNGSGTDYEQEYEDRNDQMIQNMSEKNLIYSDCIYYFVYIIIHHDKMSQFHAFYPS